MDAGNQSFLFGIPEIWQILETTQFSDTFCLEMWSPPLGGIFRISNGGGDQIILFCDFVTARCSVARYQNDQKCHFCIQNQYFIKIDQFSFYKLIIFKIPKVGNTVNSQRGLRSSRTIITRSLENPWPNGGQIVT